MIDLAPEEQLYVDIERVVAAHSEEYDGAWPLFCLFGELRHLKAFESTRMPGPRDVAPAYNISLDKAEQVYFSAADWQCWGQSWKQQLANARRVLRVRRQKLVDRGLLPQKVESLKPDD